MLAGSQFDLAGILVSLRPVADRDRDFLAAVYASTREEELANVPWTPEQKRAFVAHQFAAQDAAYTANYPGASRLVIVADGAEVGRLYLHPRAGEIRIMDIAFLPAARGRGIGTAVLQRVLAEGARSGRFVSIHVESFNPARALYERLGFQLAEAGPVYLRLEWRPSAGSQ